jgi:predicted transglutaminase-like cysteine proteinase
MRFRSFIACLAVLATAFFTGEAAVAASGPKTASLVPKASFIKAGPQTSTPYGWLDFCNRNAAECRGGFSQPAVVALTAETWRLINTVNVRVNDQITPMSDQKHWGVVDRWDLPMDGYGDCEDYVLLKRKLLGELGLPRQALLVTVVKDEKGEGHAVLTVKTDRGDYVLDNMHDRIHAWGDTGYRFVKRQSQTDPNIWVQIGEPTAEPLTVAK